MLLAGHLPLPPARSESVMSRTKSRPVVLSPAERKALRSVVRTGSHSAQQVRRARIVLELDENDPDREGPVPTQEVVAERAGVHVDTVLKTSRAFADHGGDIQATISRKKRETPPVEPIEPSWGRCRVQATRRLDLCLHHRSSTLRLGTAPSACMPTRWPMASPSWLPAARSASCSTSIRRL